MIYSRIVKLLLVAVTALLFTHCQSPDMSSPSPLEPAPLSLHWQVISHLESPGTFSSELKIINNDEEPLSNSGWTLYFNFIRMIDVSSLPASVQVTHINGDFFKLEPASDFPTLTQGQELTIPFKTNFWAVKKSDAPAGFYMVYTDASGQDAAPRPVINYTVGAFETPAQTMRNASDEVQVPTPATRFAENAALHLLDPSALPPVVPTPGRFTRGQATLSISAATRIFYQAGLEDKASQLASNLAEVLTGKPTVTESSASGPNTIFLTVDKGQSAFEGDQAGAYTLSISRKNGIIIQGADQAGVFYGIQSLRSMIAPAAYLEPQQTIEIQEIEIQDAPRFPYRGLHIDVSRNFHSKASILKVLDLMGLYKLNAFHFHLTDDEGWRLEIAGLPRTNNVGQ